MEHSFSFTVRLKQDEFSLIVPIYSFTINTKLKQDEFDRFHSLTLLPVRRMNSPLQFKNRENQT